LAKVIKHFTDKETRKVYEIGHDYEGERLEYLTGLGYLQEEVLEEIEEEVKKPTKGKK